MSTHLTATIEKTAVHPFQCTGCSFESAAVVRSKGIGESTAFLDEHGASEEARQRAVAAAEENVAFLVALATCPACGNADQAKRDQVMAEARTARFGWACAAAIGIFVLLQLGSRSFSGGLAAMLGAGAGVLTFATYRSKQQWMVEEVDARVRILTAEELAGLEDEEHAPDDSDPTGRIAALEAELTKLKAQAARRV